MESSLSPFVNRHVGPQEEQILEMLKFLGVSTLDEMISKTIPQQIRTRNPLSAEILGNGKTEFEVLKEFKKLISLNQNFKSYIGLGYYDCVTPAVIQRGILENPGWYTQYTPYQAEISQGRLEALLNFQTMIVDFTGLEIANASLLDEATAAAEAILMAYAIKGRPSNYGVFVSDGCHPQNISVVKTRCEALGIEVTIGRHETLDFNKKIFAALIQYPETDGVVLDYSKFIEEAHKHEALVIFSADLLSLALLKSPGELGVDIVVGSTQRFGVPLGYGGPHAAFLATKDVYKRLMPGRIVGISKDSDGNTAIRLALQTREQHIRREKATSNICTAQVLLAVIASMFAVYHGPHGIKEIAERVFKLTNILANGLSKVGYKIKEGLFFDTVRVVTSKEKQSQILEYAKKEKINFRIYGNGHIGISLDETTTVDDIEQVLKAFNLGKDLDFSIRNDFSASKTFVIDDRFLRKTSYLMHQVFNSYHSETKMLRYLYKLQSKDLSLTTSMIPLGSCTMKLNAATEMLPVTWPKVNAIHPFVPVAQAEGYQIIFKHLQAMLAEITGFDAISLQPNAGAQGEYTGLLVIKKFQHISGQTQRDVCLIPASAHGTNPASAAMAGLKVVVVNCDKSGNIDLAALKTKAREHAQDLACIMLTYPSTHGVFEEEIQKICEIVHENGGQVYMDGANLNAQVGLCKPSEIGADVCHLNLHKTFCIPHGGGGPGMGPIAVKKHLAPFLPSHEIVHIGDERSISAVSSAPWGSASILPISYVYILMMGAEGLRFATQVAILNANYVAKKLESYYPVLYKGKNGFVAHECIIDLRPLKSTSGIEADDVAKRLMDYGFHAPTVSFPVPGTMMIEPTESESKDELDRFCEAMVLIRKEIEDIEKGVADRKNNLLKNAPHTASQISRSEWDHSYSRVQAAFPASWLKEHKYWPTVSRIDAVYGERNLFCTCV
ncbi:MAG: aminomethyl-transferring glycine dehydrogenase [Deltaproteobacteria bacterium]|nr:aminomethyl-transferring glycine dehydrogenase [Deltaproteobacteria bacterium]